MNAFKSQKDRLFAWFGGFDIISGNEDNLEVLRDKFVKTLNGMSYIRSIENLFDEAPIDQSEFGFNPVIFSIGIPSSELKVSQYFEPADFIPEEFYILYDGLLLIVLAISNTETTPSGSYALRDYLTKVLSPLFVLRRIPPCLTPNNVVFVQSAEEIPKKTYDLYVKTDSNVQLKDLLQDFYRKFGLPMHIFYDASGIVNDIQTTLTDLDEHQQALFSVLTEFPMFDWYKIVERRELAGKIRTNIIKVIKSLSQYSAKLHELKGDAQKHLRDIMTDIPVFAKFMDLVDWRYYADIDPIDCDIYVKCVEQARSEIETYSATESTLVSALIGAIVGCMATLVVTYVVGYWKLVSP